MRNTNKASRAAYMRKFDERQRKLFRSISARLNVDSNATISTCLEALFGDGASLNCLLGSNGVERSRIARRLAESAARLAVANSHEVAIVTIRDQTWEFDATASVFDVALLRRVRTVVQKLCSASVGIIQVGCLPSSLATTRYVPQFKAVILGPGLRQSLPTALVKLQKRWKPGSPSSQPIEVEWLANGTARAVFTKVVALFTLADPLREVASGLLGDDEAWRKARYERARGRYTILSMCPLDKLLVATGELGSVLNGALAEGNDRVRKQYAASTKPLHRDQVVHFWWEQQVRRGEMSVPPFVKTR